MASGFKVQGTELWKVQTATTSVKVGNIQAFNPPSPESDEIEITDASSTAKEFIQGLRDYGEGSFEINWDPATTAGGTPNHQQLQADFDAGTVREWLIGFSDATTAPPSVSSSSFGAPATTRTWVKFVGFIKSFKITGQQGGIFKGTLVVRNSGTPTFTYRP